MRVRIWIDGPDGPSRDFELLGAPRVGERICIAHAGELEEGIVASVDWHLQAMENSSPELMLEGDPPGSVSLVQVVCRPSEKPVAGAFTAAEAELAVGLPGAKG
ncbi:MAG TPA: hypothetical protein VIO94_10795 [Phenylobacterium sp.]